MSNDQGNSSDRAINYPSHKLHMNTKASHVSLMARISRSLFAKIMLVTIGLIAFISAVWLGSGGFYLAAMARTADERDAARGINLRLLKARNAEKEFMLHSLHDPLFYEHGTSKEIEDHQITVRQIRQQIASLKEISNQQDLVDQLVISLDRYDQEFTDLSLALRARGFKDWGIVGKFQVAVHALESGLEKLNHQSLVIEVLQMRRAEKDYLLRRESTCSQRVAALLASLRNDVRNLEPNASKKFQPLLNDYEIAFQELLSIDNEIGLSNTTGHYAKAQVAAHSIDPVVTELVSHADRNFRAIRHQVMTVASTLLILGTIASIIVGVKLSHSITRPLTKLLLATQHLARGEFTNNVRASTRDEIGQLTSAFGEMALTLRDIAGMADEISSGNYTCHVQPRSENDVLGIALASMTKTLHEKTTENQRKTEELESAIQAQGRFHAAFDAAADAIFLIDQREMRFIDMNESACTSLGFSRDELLTMGPLDIATDFTHEKQEVTSVEIKEIIKNKGGVDSIETLHRRKDGSTFPVEVNLRTLKNGDKEILVASARDITYRKKSTIELELLNKQLVDSARQAGKAEIATSVLHNVGNVLNSVNVSAGLIQDKVLNGAASDLTKAINVMEQHLGDIGDYVTHDDRGKHLPRFLVDASCQMSEEEDVLLAEIRSLIGNIDHIKAVVAAQQKHAKGMSGVVQEMSLAELLEDAIHINTASMQRHSVEITREFDDLDMVLSDKQMLLQILVNLISNAKYACMESGNEYHHLTIRLLREGEDHVLIELQDNGMGIAKENLTKIFSHGFTTREEGHGFGLHSAVISANELDGSLTATSDGPGLGATFSLRIPYKPAGVPSCAI